ncbi:MAG TPA: hypothetical protein VLN49_07345 [Gemmatimonadaceae bacterium]|nr:hypothetical protein [Gemmatimonadaceae bacterium]
MQYATGDYIFTQRTWSAYLSNGLTWSGNRLRLTATLPIVVQDAGWVQYGGSGMMLPTGGMAGASSSGDGTSGNGTGGMMGGTMHGGTMTPSSNMPFSHVGIGDPVGRAEIALVPTDAGTTQLSLVGSVKAPLSDVNHGFSTGQWDVGAGLSASKSIGTMMLFADAMYWSLGNPAGASLRDVVAYSVAVGHALPGFHWSVLGNITGATSYWPGLDAPVQAGIGVGYRLESGSSLNALGAFGLTRTAPTLSLGLGWRVPIGRAR